MVRPDPVLAGPRSAALPLILRASVPPVVFNLSLSLPLSLSLAEAPRPYPPQTLPKAALISVSDNGPFDGELMSLNS